VYIATVSCIHQQQHQQHQQATVFHDDLSSQRYNKVAIAYNETRLISRTDRNRFQTLDRIGHTLLFSVLEYISLFITKVVYYMQYKTDNYKEDRQSRYAGKHARRECLPKIAQIRRENKLQTS